MRHIVPIQLLRALAATAVVVMHFQMEMIKIMGVDAAGFSMAVGAAGVDLFFVISGFVMVYASERLFGRREGPAVFFLQRAVRIVPLYWLATTLYLLLTIAVPAFGKVYSPGFTAASYLFVPALKPGADIEPIVGQGWTLNYEMFFYFVFSLAVLATRNTAVLVVSAVLAVLVVLGHILPPLPVAPEFWTNSIVIEFIFGMLIALIHRRGVRIPGFVGLALVIVGLMSFPIAAEHSSVQDPFRFVKWGLPAALVVTAAVLGNFNPTAIVWRWLAVVGDASYALYLFHSVPIRSLLYGARWAKLDGATLYWPLLFAAVVVAIALALGIHFLFERPTTRRLRGYLARHIEAWTLARPKQSDGAAKARI